MNRTLRRALVWITALLAAPAARPALGQSAVLDPLPMKVTPAVIEVGSIYDGAQVEVRGEVRIGARVIVTVRGPVKDEVFNRKRRVGPIWINSGKVHITGGPSLFFRYSSDRWGDWVSSDDLRSYQLDEVSIRDQVRMDPPDPSAGHLIRADYLAMKTRQGMFQFTDGGVLIAEYGGQRASFTATIQWPRNAPPATYAVGAYEIVRGSATRHAWVPLNVVQVGFPATISSLATNRASVYGLLAVLVAVLAGFGIDFLATLLFGKRRAAH